MTILFIVYLEFAVINVLCTIDLFDTTEPPSGAGTVYHFPEHLSSPRSLVEFVILDLKISM